MDLRLFSDSPPDSRRPVAEVVASSTRALVAEVYRDDEAPAFGAWIATAHPRGHTLYGLVSHVEIGPTDPSRRIRAHGLTDDEVRRERPHLPGLVACTLRAVWLAHHDGQTVRQTLPPHPAPLHAFVRLAAPDEIAAIGTPYDFLRTLALTPDPNVPVDELLVAALANIAAAQPDAQHREAALVEAARALSRMLRDDHERLHSILRRAG
ncbi:MAG: hypothetical protein IAE99_12115 [Rhodothermales bacterium]|nr:hypothetical protein [Rhodothermales bacterium]MCA0268626.1 hypothetical protein [Bacteroidota bacterium]